MRVPRAPLAKEACPRAAGQYRRYGQGPRAQHPAASGVRRRRRARLGAVAGDELRLPWPPGRPKVGRRGARMSIVVSGVSKRFNEFVALDDVSVEVHRGSLTALLGPSGSGKSTLLRVIAGLERPEAGSVTISGLDVTHRPPQDRGVGFVF